MPTKPADDEDLDDMDVHHPHLPNTTPLINTHTHHSIMYAPKCLVLVSRLSYFETFRVIMYFLQFSCNIQIMT